MSRAIDLIITYRVVKMLVTPFKKFKAFELGIIDEKGKSLRKMKEVKGSERKHYTMLHRFVFNLKRILQKAGLGGRLGTFAVALATLIRENKEFEQHQKLIESVVVKYLKEQKLYEELLKEEGHIVGNKQITEQPINTCFGIDLYQIENNLVEEKEYAKSKI